MLIFTEKGHLSVLRRKLLVLTVRYVCTRIIQNLNIMRNIFRLIQTYFWIIVQTDMVQVQTDMVQVQTLSLHALSQTECFRQGNP
jgi:hypothetical protein